VRVGIVVAFILGACAAILVVVDLALEGRSGLASLGKLATLIAWISAIFVAFKSAFRLSTGRVWALFGIYAAWVVLLFILQALVTKPYVAEAFVLSTPSMSPTIEAQDHFFVEKLLRPRRWDIIAFRHTDNGQTSVFCKRLVGLPGERLRFEGGAVYVDDHAMTAPAVVAGRYHASPFRTPMPVAPYQDGQTISLGNHEYFVVGDNVNVSKDSRIYGPIDASSLVGVADLNYWPPDRVHIFR
jgi:signal peptidase I